MAPQLPIRTFPLANTSKEVCFINVVLQLLRYLTEASKRIYSYNGKSEVDRVQLARTDIVYDRVMTELRKIFRRDVGDAETLRLLTNFLPARMKVGHQDCLEFMNILMPDYLPAEKSLFDFDESAYYYCESCEMVSLTVLYHLQYEPLL
jgi:hypothetical protein